MIGMKDIDLLIHARWIIPVEPDEVVLEDHALAIHEGRILDILPGAQANGRYRAAVQRELPQHLLIPGLINTHTHAAMTLLRGLADDLPLMEWLHRHIWPAEQRWICEEFVHDGTRLAAAEMLRGGTTCFNDMYFFPDVAAKAAVDVGIRANVGLIVVDFPTPWAQDAEEYLAKGLHVHDQFRDEPLVSTAFAPHAPYSVSDAPLERVRTLADELEIPVHMHVHETADEVNQAVAKDGIRPMERLAGHGLVSPSLIAVHMTQLNEGEMDFIARQGAHVVHCPESNLKLASGYCQVTALMERGVNVALGTDGTASNNDLDLLGEMRTAALLAKGMNGDPAALPAHTVLRMATLNGARALGLDQDIGSLEVGKAADVVAIDLGGLDTQPVYHPVSHLVYAVGRQHVTDVWVAGRHVLRDGRLTDVDEAELIERAVDWGRRIGEADAAGD
jgi:5-methylthioadenosine/S-adenosylhomocysteine deaminase